jgi:AraC-like DNA-binding protein
LTNVSLIAAVFLVISLPLITRPADLLPDDPPPDDSKNRLDAADEETHGALVRAMDNRAYARTGLSIRQLAEELKIPEHRLRALINSQLGYKNFSTFLNGYRIKEACDRLRDPREARIPVLTIALDAGFASIAPFNPAFRQSVGMTPTEYRRQKLQSGSVVTAIRG